MCGIAGVLCRAPGNGVIAEHDIHAMIDVLRHRGPDDSGTWANHAAGVTLGFRRLSIIDLGPDGHQPMLTPDGRGVLLFNGEIYNYRALREELDAGGWPGWVGTSDTEVLLAALRTWGVPETLGRLDGMFAFAYWDDGERCLWLARDRFGEKPLYYGALGDDFVFASELNSLRQQRSWRGEIDRRAVARYLQRGFVPGPMSIYEDIHKLEPGTWLRIQAVDHRFVERRGVYWSAIAAIEADDPLNCSDADAVEELDRLLRSSVGERMHADVPLGAFLSGGIDSSTVVALMQAQSMRPVQTFTIGFDSVEHDEAVDAAAIAAHLGTDHTELYVRPEDAVDVIPLLPHVYDEPFSDSSQIPTLLVSRLARESVTVALTGDGGDELFGGYLHYARVGGVQRASQWLPSGLRRAVARSITGLEQSAWDATARVIVPRRWRPGRPGHRMHRLGAMLRCDDPRDMYHSVVSNSWPAGVVVGAPPVDRIDPFRATLGLERWMMGMDSLTFLPDDILVKVDRASMAFSLEARAPFLDHELFEFSTRVPLTMIRRDGRTKWLLREVLRKYVPESLTERPKRGFGVPIDEWLRGPLRQWADEMLDPAVLARQGLLEPAPIRAKLDAHLAGTRDWGRDLWCVLNLQAWYTAHLEATFPA